MLNNTRRWILDLTLWTLSLLVGMALIAHDAMAEGNVMRADNARWRAECGSCHIAYPPQLLPAASWRRVMSELERHFGTDATLDAGPAAEIGAFLEQSSGTGKRVRGVADEPRITRTPWFVREHDEVPAAAWRRPAIKSAANCAACHAGAGQGDFRERDIRMPR
jgi:cytochrome c553